MPAPLQLECDGLVGADGRGREVPRALVGMRVAAGDGGEGPVHPAPLGRVRAVEDRGANQRVAELDAGIDPDQRRGDRGVGRARRHSQLIGRAPDDRGVLRGVGRCEQQERLRRVGELVHLREEVTLQPPAHRQRFGQRTPARELLRGEAARQLADREGAPARLRDDLATSGSIGPSTTASRSSGRPRAAPRRDAGEPVEWRARLSRRSAHRERQRDAVSTRRATRSTSSDSGRATACRPRCGAAGGAPRLRGGRARPGRG